MRLGNNNNHITGTGIIIGLLLAIVCAIGFSLAGCATSSLGKFELPPAPKARPIIKPGAKIKGANSTERKVCANDTIALMREQKFDAAYDNWKSCREPRPVFAELTMRSIVLELVESEDCESAEEVAEHYRHGDWAEFARHCAEDPHPPHGIEVDNRFLEEDLTSSLLVDLIEKRQYETAELFASTYATDRLFREAIYYVGTALVATGNCKRAKMLYNWSGAEGIRVQLRRSRECVAPIEVDFDAIYIRGIRGPNLDSPLITARGPTPAEDARFDVRVDDEWQLDSDDECLDEEVPEDADCEGVYTELPFPDYSDLLEEGEEDE